MKKIRIIGVGNVFMSDDGFGPAVARMLEAFYDLPPCVDVIDGGVPGFSLTPHLMGAVPLVVIIHAAPGEGAPGEIRVRRPSDGDQAAWPAGNVDVVAIGVVPEWVATGVTLSRPVRSALAPVVGLVVTELERLGVTLVRRPIPREPDLWWASAGIEALSAGRGIIRPGCGF